MTLEGLINKAAAVGLDVQDVDAIRAARWLRAGEKVFHQDRKLDVRSTGITAALLRKYPLRMRK